MFKFILIFSSFIMPLLHHTAYNNTEWKCGILRLAEKNQSKFKKNQTSNFVYILWPLLAFFSVIQGVRLSTQNWLMTSQLRIFTTFIQENTVGHVVYIKKALNNIIYLKRS